MTRRDRMLAQDPQNLTWKNNTSRFGVKMLEKMGWTQGKGLGKDQQGSTEYVRPTFNKGSFGLGVETLDEDTSWKKSIQDLDGILGGLKNWNPQDNQEEEDQKDDQSEEEEEPKPKKSKKATKEERSSSDDEPAEEEKPESDAEEEEPKSRVPRHLLFTRRHRNKQVVNYSKTDLAAILGVAPPKVDSTEDVASKTNITTKTSKISSKDYFSKKIQIVEEQDDGEYRKMSKRTTIVKRPVQVEDQVENEVEEEEEVEVKQVQKKRKPKKVEEDEEEEVQVEIKLKKKTAVKKKVVQEEEEEEEEAPVVKKKKVTPVKKSKVQVEVQVEEEEEEEEVVQKPVRKQPVAKKPKKVQVEAQVEEEEEEEPVVKKPVKKSKK